MASVGSIVFGMEDGTVSIFGLVFGWPPRPPTPTRYCWPEGPAR
jgi:hypothetical protein